MLAVKNFAIIVFVCWLSTFYCDCRPLNDKTDDKTNPINVHDTDDEFVIKKPATGDSKYSDFLDELYKHDNEKQASKSKRDVSNSVSEASIHGETKFFNIAEKSAVNNNIKDNDDVNRGRRMIVFRPLFVYRKEQLRKQKYEGSVLKSN